MLDLSLKLAEQSPRKVEVQPVAPIMNSGGSSLPTYLPGNSKKKQKVSHAYKRKPKESIVNPGQKLSAVLGPSFDDDDD